MPSQQTASHNSSNEISISSDLNSNVMSFETNNNMTQPENRAFVGTNFEFEKNSFSLPERFQTHKRYRFLSTALIKVQISNGEKLKICTLLDMGSQVNLIQIADILRIKLQTINAPLSGLNNSVTTIKCKLTTLLENLKGD